MFHHVPNELAQAHNDAITVCHEGEKARVALSMFALKASNLLLLDEPSNHLDVEW